MLTLLEAANSVGVSKSTLRRSVKNGQLSATISENGAYMIDPAELHRVFKTVSKTRAESDVVEFHEAADFEPMKRLKAEFDHQKIELEAARQRCRDLELDRDRWYEETQATKRLLTHFKPPETPIARQSFFRRLFG